MMRILVTGASGLLGLNLCMVASSYGYEVIGVVNHNLLAGVPFQVMSTDLSLIDRHSDRAGAFERLLDQTRPDVIVHCAAMANVDECERLPNQAMQINAIVPGLLAKAAVSHGIQMVHISTDAVFDGVRGEYVETDAPSPINQYARTKLAGEQAVSQANPEALIARVNFYGWSLHGKRSLAEWFYHQLSTGQPVKGFIDVYFCPLHVHQLVDLLLAMVDKKLTGMYHVVSSQQLSKHEFGLRIAQRFGLNERLITPASWRDGNLTAARSPNLTLSTMKLTQSLGFPPPGQSSGLELFYNELQAGYPQRLKAFSKECSL